MRKISYVSVWLGCVALLIGCEKRPSAPRPDAIRLATTTSLENSGLLDVLLSAFREQTGIEVQVMPMGSGRALQTARDGNCDVVVAHAPKAEEQFIRQGWSAGRRKVMYNHMLILGPASDPAKIAGTASAVEAAKKIAASMAVFVSRGDNSGTHQKELQLWAAAGVEPSGRWYRCVGKGMGETLIVANEMDAYVLADFGTYLKFRSKLRLARLLENDSLLHNPYSIMAVSPARHPHVKCDQAARLIEFVTSRLGQKLIGDYRIGDEAPFHPWPGPSGDRRAAIRIGANSP